MAIFLLFFIEKDLVVGKKYRKKGSLGKQVSFICLLGLLKHIVVRGFFSWFSSEKVFLEKFFKNSLFCLIILSCSCITVFKCLVSSCREMLYVSLYNVNVNVEGLKSYLYAGFL